MELCQRQRPFPCCQERLRFPYKKRRTRYNNSSRFRETGAGVARVSRINPRHRTQAPCSRTKCRRCRNTYKRQHTQYMAMADEDCTSYTVSDDYCKDRFSVVLKKIWVE